MGKIEELKEKQTETFIDYISFVINKIKWNGITGKDEENAKKVSEVFKGVDTNLTKYLTWETQNSLHLDNKLDKDGRTI